MKNLHSCRLGHNLRFARTRFAARHHELPEPRDEEPPGHRIQRQRAPLPIPAALHRTVPAVLYRHLAGFRGQAMAVSGRRRQTRPVVRRPGPQNHHRYRGRTRRRRVPSAFVPRPRGGVCSETRPRRARALPPVAGRQDDAGHTGPLRADPDQGGDGPSGPAGQRRGGPSGDAAGARQAPAEQPRTTQSKRRRVPPSGNGDPSQGDGR